MMGLAIKFGPWVLLVVMTGLYLDKRDDLASSIEKCNTDKLASIAEAERITRDVTQRAADERVAAAEAMAAAESKAKDEATEIAHNASTEALKAGQRIRELELEASIDDIPDSNECLNVFVPSRVLYPGDCGETGASGSGEAGACGSSEGVNQTDPAFAIVTYGDSMKLWLQDRAGLTACNGQLGAIESLNESD